MKTASEILKLTSDLLLENQKEWGPVWRKYAQDLIKRYPKPDSVKSNTWREAKKKFRCPPEFGVYANISKMMNATTMFDLRYRGQLVGFLNVKKDKHVTLTVDKNCAKNNEKHFNWHFGTIDDVSWSKDKKAYNFRRYFKELGAASGHSEEHAWESLILKDLEKKSRANKSLPNVRPISLGRTGMGADEPKKEGTIRFQMPLPVSGSDKTGQPTYNANSAGHTDILVRIGPGGTTIGILELKKPKPGKVKPLSQALIYGTALAHVLRNDQGQRGWWWLFGFDREIPEPLTIKLASLCHVDDSGLVEKDRAILGIEYGELLTIPTLKSMDRVEVHRVDYSGDTVTGDIKLVDISGFTKSPPAKPDK